MKKFTKKAFTLVEMLIVVVIIGILAATLVPKITSAQAKARDTGRIADLTQLGTALTALNAEEGEYPNAESESILNTNGVTWGCVADLATVLWDYMSTVPTDVQVQRVTYWTVIGTGCENWSYGYTATKYRNSANAGAIVFANTEVFGKAFNYLLTWANSTTQLLYVPSNDDNEYCWASWDLAGCATWEDIDLKYFKIILAWTWNGDTDIDRGGYFKPNF